MYYVLPLLSAAALIGADRLTKYLCATRMALYESITVIPGFVRLYATRNAGAAFGLFEGARWVFLALTAAALAAMAYFYVTWPRARQYRVPRICLTAIFAGAVGNAIDRAAFGEVIDFIDFTFVNFAVFNVADICVTVGAVAFAAYALFGAWGKKDE